MINPESITLDDVKTALEARDFKLLRAAFRTMNAADISEIFEEHEIVDVIVLFRLVPKARRAEIFSYLNFEQQEEMLDRLPDLVVISLLNEMEPVDRTKLLEELPQEISSKIILKLSPEERKIAWQLLSYPEDSVGRLMSPEFVALKSGMTVKEALAYIRWNANQFPISLLHHLFVVDDDGKLLGALGLPTLVVADPATLTLEQIMDKSVLALKVYEDQGLAVDFFRKYDRPYIPIVDDEGVLVGIVEADDVFDVAEEEATEDIQAFGGQAVLEDSYFQTPIHVLIRKRAGWLAVLFIGSLFTATALQYYEDAIKTMSYIVFFLPLIISSGGNSGSQAASLIIRGLAVKEVAVNDWFKVFQREVIIGLLLGIILGVLGYLRVTLGGLDSVIGLTVGLAIVAVVLFGALAGSMLPFALKALKLDPAVSSSPMIASISDLVGIIMLFNIATYLIVQVMAG